MDHNRNLSIAMRLQHQPTPVAHSCHREEATIGFGEDVDHKKESIVYRRIVVPLDGSKLAERALPESERLARLIGAPIHLVRVIDGIRGGQLGTQIEVASAVQAHADEHTAASLYVQMVAEGIVLSGIAADSEVRIGQTPQELVAAAKPGDLLVMASHGRGGITRLILGSVTEDVLRHAPVPILLIKVDTPEAAKRRSIPGPQVATAY